MTLPGTQRGLVRRCPRTRISICPAVQHQAYLLLLFLTTACLSPGQATEQGLQSSDDQGTVKGIVVNSITHAPLSRALVSSPDNRFATMTDGEGHFEFALPKSEGADRHTFYDGPVPVERPVLRRGIFSVLTARKPGYLDDPNSRAAVDVSSGGEITIPLMPEALIKGRVIRSDADPALGITVQILSRMVQEGMPKWTRTASMKANSNGEFRFAELRPGTYKVVTDEFMDNDPATTVPGGQQYGFPPVYYPGVPDPAAAGTIQLTAGQSVEIDIPLTRQPYYPVRIPIANEEVNGGLNITVSLLGHGSADYSLGYNPEKQSIEGLLPNGNYLVEAATYGNNSVAGSVHLAVASTPAEGSTLTLIPSTSISVRVTEEFTSADSDNSTSMFSAGGKTFRMQGPRSYLQIGAESADDLRQGGGSLRPPTGPNDESLVLENLTPGRYWLRLNSSRGYVAAATMGGVDLLRQPLIVGGGSSAPVEVTMRDDNAELEGTVSGVANGPGMGDATPSSTSRQQLWVYCVPLPDSPGRFQQVWVAADGKFTAAAMAPGAYRVLAFKNLQVNIPYRDAEAMRTYENKGPVVHLSAGQKTNVQLQITSDIE